MQNNTQSVFQMASRIVSEIEGYLATTTWDEGDYWENEERRSLRELLARLKED